MHKDAAAVYKPDKRFDAPGQRLKGSRRSKYRMASSTLEGGQPYFGLDNWPSLLIKMKGELTYSAEGALPSAIYLRVNGPDERRRQDMGANAGAPKADPLQAFLDRTLVRRTKLLSRNGVRFVTLRAWRKSLKAEQIDVFRAMKLAPTQPLVDLIAGEIEALLHSVLGANPFDAIVPMPCGHSVSDACLSVRIADRVAQHLGIPLRSVLTATQRSGSSHPKDNARRPPLRLAEPVQGAILLIDDIATSGRHIEEAVTFLRPSCKSVFPVAWLSGVAES